MLNLLLTILLISQSGFVSLEVPEDNNIPSEREARVKPLDLRTPGFKTQRYLVGFEVAKNSRSALIKVIEAFLFKEYNPASLATGIRTAHPPQLTEVYQHFVENSRSKSLLSMATRYKFDKICQ